MITAVLTYRVDTAREIDIPAAVVFLDHQGNLTERLPTAVEEPSELCGTPYRSHVGAHILKLHRWLDQGILPYCEATPDPFSREWWEHAQKLFQHSVRLRSIGVLVAPVSPEQALEVAFRWKVLGKQ